MGFFLKGFIVLLLTLLSTQSFAQEKINVIATFSILGDVVKNVGGNKIDLAVLVGSDGDAHTFEPTPKESVLLAHADIIFENGLYFEHWIDHLYEAAGSKAIRVVVTAGIEPIAISSKERVDLKGNPKDVDPHAWHDVKNVMLMTQRIRDGLMAIDPQHATYYQENAQGYLHELSNLDLWVDETLRDIQDERRQLVTSHDALGYFAKRYGFKVIGAVIPSATTEAEDPSAEHIARLLNLVKSSGVKAIFAENIHNAKLMKMLSKETGVVLAPKLYTDALGQQKSEGETYIKMMRHNVLIFAEYLK